MGNRDERILKFVSFCYLLAIFWNIEGVMPVYFLKIRTKLACDL